MMLTRSQLRVILISTILTPLFLFFAYPSRSSEPSTGRSAWSWLLPSGATSTGAGSSWSSGKVDDNTPRMSTVINHAPGFTIVENVYWRNYTYYFLTDKPWHVPQLKLIASTMNLDRYDGPRPDVGAKILAVRNRAIDSHMDETRELGISTTPEAALEVSKEAVEVPGTHFLLNDADFIGHYYHFIGETFLGAWRIVQNYFYQTGKRIPPFTNMGFLRSYEGDELPGISQDRMWQDHAGANKFFLNAFFPEIKIQTRLDWEDMAATGEMYRFPLAVIGDRYAGHDGPSASWKPWGDVLRLPVHPTWLTELRDRVVKIKRGRKPHVLYLTRQDTTRRLTDQDHSALVYQLRKLEEDGLVQLTIKTFTDGDSFVDQVALIGTVDFFVSVHGNGLTHTLWMNSGKHRAVFELQVKGCIITDYSPLAIAAGVQHYLVTDDIYCTPHTCARRGCKEGVSINVPNIKVKPTVVTDKIRELVAEYKYD
ncbi:hypothetical protein Q8F55_000741 [Vanrija albida]|uniref:Glycosyltransferase 61 catalytic domain-containing protein n=1 Tax=Vanrija albida TaxID=181172 RepID=A0ABR3QEA8_9TREE